MFGLRRRQETKPWSRGEPTTDPVPPSRQNRVFFYLLLAATLFSAVVLFKPFLGPVVTGVLLAYLAHPVYRFFRSFVRHPSVSAILALLFIVGLLVVPVASLGLALVDDARGFAVGLVDQEPPEFVLHAFDLWVSTRVDDPQNATQIADERTAIIQGLLVDASQFLVAILPETIAFIGDLILGTFIVAFLMFYVFKDGERFIDFTRHTVPLPPHQTDFLFRETGKAIDAIFVGQLFSALLQGLVGGIGFAIFGVDNAFFWGAVMAFLSLLPVIGAFLVWAPAAVILAVSGDTLNGLLLGLWGLILVSNVDNVAKPILIGDRASIHPIMVLIGILGGLLVFGPIGFIVGPLLLAILVAVLTVWNAEYHDGTGWLKSSSPMPEDDAA